MYFGSASIASTPKTIYYELGICWANTVKYNIIQNVLYLNAVTNKYKL